MTKFKFDLEKRVLDYIKNYPNSSSREIYEGLGNVGAFATIKRTITTLLDKNFVSTNGKGKATRYVISLGFDVLLKCNVTVITNPIYVFVF